MKKAWLFGYAFFRKIIKESAQLRILTVDSTLLTGVAGSNLTFTT